MSRGEGGMRWGAAYDCSEVGMILDQNVRVRVRVFSTDAQQEVN